MIEGLYRKTKKTGVSVGVVALLALLASGSASADGMRYQLGLSYVNGFDNLFDQYEENLEAEGYFTWSQESLPVGLVFQPYYQWDNGFRLGVDAGPIMLIWGDVDHFQLPFNVNVGYTFNLSGSVPFYVRGGPSYHFASGDYYDGSNIGFMVGVGAELFKSKRTSFVIQAAYDSAEVDIEDVATGSSRGIKAAEFSVGLLIAFK
jgi:hypothetical protein